MRKIIDDRGRLFGIISIVDVVVVAVAAVIIAAVLVRASRRETPYSSVNTTTVTYVAEIYEIRQASAELIRRGDKLYTNTMIYIGTIKEVAVEPAEVVSLKADGTYAVAPSEERYDVTLTVEAQCSVASGRYYADRTYQLCANTEEKIVTKYVDTTCTILSVTAD